MKAEFKVTKIQSTVSLIQVGTEDRERKHQKVIVFSMDGSDLPEVGDIFVLVRRKETKKK